MPGLVPPHDASTLAILPRKANGPAVRLGHSVDDQARRVLDNAGPLNFHSPTRDAAAILGFDSMGHIRAYSPI